MLTWARRIVGDARAMRQDILGLSSESEGQVRLAAIPSVMSLVARLTVPFQTKHPKLKLTLLSRSSNAILSMLNQREIDAGITYLSNEPIGEVVATPIYREEYRLLVTNTGLFADREVVTWAEAATIPLCLLERDMQNRRIVDGVLRRLDVEPTPMMETDSMPALFSYVRLGHCGSIVPSSAAEPAQLGDDLRAIPLVEPELHHIVGLVVSKRFPAQPAVTALVHAASMLAPQLRGARFSGD